MAERFKHESLGLDKKRKIVFASFSKKNFYLRNQISAYILLAGQVPVNPFMNFDYNLSGLVDKSMIRVANNTLIKKSDELWVFGEVSDGVLDEISLAKKLGLPVQYFRLDESFGKIRQIWEEDVRLEDISPWMWEWVQAGKSLERWHPRLRFKKTYPLIYPAYSKRNFYWQVHISKYCIEELVVPLNPFMLFRYFLGDMIPRESVYEANNNLIRICDQLWTFGEISDGVLAEIKQTKDSGKKVKHFRIIDQKPNPVTFKKILPSSISFEKEDGDLQSFRSIVMS
jgi:hypothetical protein